MHVGRAALMAEVRAEAEAEIGAPADAVYRCLADAHQHAEILPPAFSGFTVHSGGVGAGTVLSFTFTAGGRSRHYEMTVAEPEPGRVLTETDARSSLVTTFTVDPVGERSRVRITTTWQGAGGVGGFFEKRFAPKALRRVYADELQRLDDHMRRKGLAG